MIDMIVLLQRQSAYQQLSTQNCALALFFLQLLSPVGDPLEGAQAKSDKQYF